MKHLAIMFSLCCLIGCASIGHPIDQNAVNKIQKDITTKQQVAELLGNPDRVTTSGNICMWTYQYARASAKAATFIPIAGAFAGGMNTQSQVVMIRFDQDGIVRDVTDSHSGMESDSGLATQRRASMPDVEQNKRP